MFVAFWSIFEGFLARLGDNRAERGKRCGGVDGPSELVDSGFQKAGGKIRGLLG